jgi:hypothetical protein
MAFASRARHVGRGGPRKARWGRYPHGRADVAQLVEHFTRNEGVRGSNPRVGYREGLQMQAFSCYRARTLRVTANESQTRRV